MMSKLKIAIGLGVCMCISANGFHEPITVQIELPPPAEVLEAVGDTVQGVSDYLTAQQSQPADAAPRQTDVPAAESPAPAAAQPPEQETLFRIRNAANDPRSQIGAYGSLESAVSVCPPSYCVFDGSGTLRYAG